MALETFVDRESFQQSFHKILSRNTDEKYKVLSYYGVGGIGKTSLRKKLESSLKEKHPGIISASINFDTSQLRYQDAALSSLRQQLRTRYKIEFPTFEIAYAIYWRKVHPDAAKNKMEIPFMDEGSIVSEIISSLGEWPVIGVAPKITKIFLKGHSRLKNWWIKHGEESLRQLEFLEPKDIEDRLPMFWASDLVAYLEKTGEAAVFFIDTYEALWESDRTMGNHSERDTWVRELIAQLPTPTIVSWVIFGREFLRWKEVDHEWEDFLEQHLIGNLAEYDIRNLLNIYGINDLRVQEEISKSSEGHPFYLDLAVENFYQIKEDEHREPIPADFSGTPERILNRFLKYLDRQEKAALYVLSAPRNWDRVLFDLLLSNFDTGYPRQLFTELMRFSFINQETNEDKNEIYIMHRLMRKSLQEHQGELDCREVHRFLFEHYAKMIPDEEIIGISKLHIDSLSASFYHAEKIFDINELYKWFETVYKPFHNQAQYKLLIDLYLEILDLLNKTLGTEHSDVASTLYRLALLNYELGRYDRAETLYLQALRIREKVLGESHPEVATTLNFLAALYRDQGKYDDSVPLYMQALKIREKALGPDHPEVAATLNSLAVLYRNQRRYADAELLFRRALKIREENLGSYHPDVATTLNSLAVLYRGQGRYDDAELLFRRALKIREKNLGAYHPDVATTLNSLAVLYRGQGKYSDAEPLFLRSLKIREQIFGPDHPDVATTLNGLAVQYRLRGIYSNAEPLFLRALKIREQILSPDHPDLITTLKGLARMYEEQGKNEFAEALIKKVPKYNRGPQS